MFWFKEAKYMGQNSAGEGVIHFGQFSKDELITGQLSGRYLTKGEFGRGQFSGWYLERK